MAKGLTSGEIEKLPLTPADKARLRAHYGVGDQERPAPGPQTRPVDADPPRASVGTTHATMKGTDGSMYKVPSLAALDEFADANPGVFTPSQLASARAEFGGGWKEPTAPDLGGDVMPPASGEKAYHAEQAKAQGLAPAPAAQEPEDLGGDDRETTEAERAADAEKAKQWGQPAPAMVAGMSAQPAAGSPMAASIAGAKKKAH